MEDESHEIGKVGIPHAFFLGMRTAPLVFMDIPQEQRARHLVAEYAVAPPELLKEAFEKIGKRLGGAALKEALGALDRGDPYTAALLSLQYYDKTYAFGLSARDDNRVRRIDGAGADPRELARRVMETA
ncbi:MAG TPA: hypothetical protein P5248_11040, partial [Bacteroidales bacterium]|nr:hypothetical protein [Bacteroidales bacterium]